MYITNDKLQLKKKIVIKYVTVVQYSGIQVVIGKELRLTSGIKEITNTMTEETWVLRSIRMKTMDKKTKKNTQKMKTMDKIDEGTDGWRSRGLEEQTN